MLQKCVGLVVLLCSVLSHGLQVERSLLRVDAGQPSQIEDVLSSSAWQPVQAFGNHGFTDDVFWLRLNLTFPDVRANDASNPTTEFDFNTEDWVVKLMYPVHDEVDVYQIQLGAIQNHWVMGDARPDAKWVFQSKFFAVPITLSEGQSTQVLIRVAGHNSKVLGTEVKSYETFREETLIRNVLAGAFYGMLLIMGLYNLSLAFLVKDPSYYVYVAYVFLFGFLALALTGDGRFFIWKEAYQFNHYAIPLAGGLLALPTIFFPYYLLNVPKNAPRLKKYFWGLALLSAGYLAALVFVSVGLSLKLINVINIVTTLFSLATGVYLAIKKVPVAWIYTLAWSFIISGLVVLSLAAYNVIPMNHFTRNANLMGGLIEMVLLSLALAQRIHMERKAKLNALQRVATTEIEVKIQRKMYQQLFEQAPVGIFNINHRGELAAANPELCRMLNFANQNVALAHAKAFRYYFKNQQALTDQVVRDGTVIDGETTLITHDGEEKICSVSLTARQHSGELEIEGYLTDISQRKKAEEIRDMMEKARMASLEQLVTGVAHEINTPLGVNITSVSNVKSELAFVDEKMRDGTLKKMDFEQFSESTKTAIELMEENLKRIANLVKRFKMVSVQHAHSNGEKEKLDLVRFSENLIRGYLAGKDNVELSVVCNGELDVEIEPATFNILFEHLVENSLAHGFAKGQQGKIDVRFTLSDNILEMIYRDNGVGVDAGIRDTLFNPFVTTRRGNSSNTGLGLYRVYNLVVQRLHGKIHLLNDAGFAVRIEFPLQVH